MKNNTKIDLNSQYTLAYITSRKLQIAIILLGFINVISGYFLYSTNDAIGIGLIISGVIFIILFMFFWKVLLKKQLKKQSKYNVLLKGNTVNYYEFEEEKLNITTFKNNDHIGQSVYKYNDLYKVIDYRNYLFLFIGMNQAFIVSKDGMTEGNIENIILLLKKNVEKYKVKK